MITFPRSYHGGFNHGKYRMCVWICGSYHNLLHFEKVVYEENVHAFLVWAAEWTWFSGQVGCDTWKEGANLIVIAGATA